VSGAVSGLRRTYAGDTGTLAWKEAGGDGAQPRQGRLLVPPAQALFPGGLGTAHGGGGSSGLCPALKGKKLPEGRERATVFGIRSPWGILQCKSFDESLSIFSWT